MLNEAVEFCDKGMKDSFGKGTKRPYIVHPIEVADIVTTMTRDPEVICAAVLHDTIGGLRRSDEKRWKIGSENGSPC